MALLHSCSDVATVKTSKACVSTPVIGYCVYDSLLKSFFFFFCIVLFLILSFPIKCRFNYLNLSY